MPAGRTAYVLDHPLGGLFCAGVFWFHASFLRHYDETKTLLKSQHQFGDIGADGEQARGRDCRIGPLGTSWGAPPSILTGEAVVTTIATLRGYFVYSFEPKRGIGYFPVRELETQ